MFVDEIADKLTLLLEFELEEETVLDLLFLCLFFLCENAIHLGLDSEHQIILVLGLVDIVIDLLSLILGEKKNRTQLPVHFYHLFDIYFLIIFHFNIF